MAVHRAFTCYALALTVLIGPTVAEAQQQKQKSCNDLASEEVLEARRACFEEAKQELQDRRRLVHFRSASLRKRLLSQRRLSPNAYCP